MDTLASLLLKKELRVHIDPSLPTQSRRNLNALENDLLDLGFVLGADLHHRLAVLADPAYQHLTRSVLSTLRSMLGGHKSHVPLFRNFPESVPRDTFELWKVRMLSYLLQDPQQPCMWCGRTSTVYGLDPCGHLVCRDCWDGREYSGCPICHKRVDLQQPFFQLPADPGPYTLQPTRLKVLQLSTDLDGDLQRMLGTLLTRTSPLPPGERQDLITLITLQGKQVLEGLTGPIPVKETLALLLGTLLRQHPTRAFFETWVQPRLRTATDVLRTLVVYSGAHEGLTGRPRRLLPLKRDLRRSILQVLSGFSVFNLTEDLLRYPGLWKRLGQTLHPFEHHRQFPGVALAFAVLRGTRLDSRSELGQTVLGQAALHPAHFEVREGKLHYRSWKGQMERVLQGPHLQDALGHLSRRPGEFGRKLDLLVRKATTTGSLPALETAFEALLPRVSAGVLLTLMAHLPSRTLPLKRRVFFPKGTSGIVYHTPDVRPVLPRHATARLQTLVEQELLRRAARLPGCETAVLDETLRSIPLPFNEKSTSGSLIALPRGSTLKLPEGQHLRLFLHWMQDGSWDVDLDLSVGFYNDRWQMVSCCDFTSLRLPEDSAVHSGDLTSAPLPLGASEFVDLHLEKLRAQGVRHAVMMVFSYSRISFDRLPEAFAGVMFREPHPGPAFDPRTVQQRFDLTGQAQVALPLRVDLHTREMQWLDVKMTPSKSWNSIRGYQQPVEVIGEALQTYFQRNSRPTVWQLFCLHAAVRCLKVQVKRQDGNCEVFQRLPDETPLQFFHRLQDLQGGQKQPGPGFAGPVLGAQLYGDETLPAGSLSFHLFPGRMSPERVQHRRLSEWVADLRPLEKPEPK